ncbi:MAG: shikimate kinase [Candidatus Lokiarchaeota archaeon]|jgi:shikimate kinase
MIKDSIALIGFMATGKSTVGKALAKRLGKEFQFLESDDLIIKIAGKSIPEIFSEDGEAVFRHYEIEVCRKISKQSKVVVSCGGGVVLNQINIDNLRKNCYIVLLNASIQEIYKRILKDGIKNRPLIDTTAPLDEIMQLLEYRQPLYNSAADFRIETTGKSIKKIVENIKDKLKSLNFF